MQHKKRFELSELHKYKRYEHMLWLIPVGMFLLILCVYVPQDEILREGNLEGILPGVTLFFLMVTILLSAIPYFACNMLIKIKRKAKMQNCTISDIQGFDYYRDKLEGLRPSDISMLINLEIEQKKDVSATILQYENQGILKEQENGTYCTTEKYKDFQDLSPSDRYLIQHLVQDDFDWENDTQWKKMAREEAVEEGYITIKPFRLPEEKPVTKGKIIFRKVMRIPLILFLIFWLVHAIPRMEAFQNLYEPASEQVQNGGDSVEIATDLMKHIMGEPVILLGMVEQVLILVFAIFVLCYKADSTSRISKGMVIVLGNVIGWICLCFLAMPCMLMYDDMGNYESMTRLARIMFEDPQIILMIGCGMMAMLLPLYWIVFLVAVFSRRGNAILNEYYTAEIKRTEYGNYMAECIYGMKNFIHDYSNLSEADKRQVVLWEDYLVYAVLLEENEKIVDEIYRKRREVS